MYIYVNVYVYMCVYIYVCVYIHTHTYIPYYTFSIDLGCFHGLAIVNTIGINIGAHVFFQYDETDSFL